MNTNKLTIVHSADLQVRNRRFDLFKVSELALKSIESVLNKTNADIYVIAGDLFEYSVPTDLERKLIYQHIIRASKINSVKEIIIIAGNHDLTKERKKSLSEQEETYNTNAISLFKSISDLVINDCSIKYLEQSGVYESEVSNNIQYLNYSLLDMKYNSEEYRKEMFEKLDTSKQTIVLYHAMLREYVETANLPLTESAIAKLDSLDIFPENSLITAGDIHLRLQFEKGNRKFIYPGSPMQHTFGEGSFYDLSSNNHKIGESKAVSVYKFTGNSYQHFEAPLNEYLSYNTLIFDSAVPFNIQQTALEQIEFNVRENTYFKVKLPSTFISHEVAIREYLNKLGATEVLFDYSQVKLAAYDNSVIDKIESIKVNSDMKVITPNNVDDLMLNNDQLKDLFGACVDSICKQTDFDTEDVSAKDIRDSVVDLFTKELSIALDSSSKRYQCKFESIETNGFMSLGNVKVNLNNEGVTRIIGTNGVGKTTIYRMLRWVLTGMCSEGLTSSHVQKNNLLVFNKNRPDINSVVVKLSLIINNEPIEVIRTTTRSWKQEATDIQKLSDNWVNFISGVTNNFELVIGGKSYSSAAAEKKLLEFFGETINTILFLNHRKIESILNLPSSKLNELVLNYIGVDYLDKLEERLNDVKSDLVTAKPKTNKETLFEQITDAGISIKNAQENKTSVSSEITKLEDSIAVVNSEITELRTKFDSIPFNEILFQKLLDEQSQLFSDKTNIEKFLETNTERELPVFEMIQPVMDEAAFKVITDKLALLYKEEEEIKKESEIINSESSKVEEKIKENTNKIGTINYKIRQLKDEYVSIINKWILEECEKINSSRDEKIKEPREIIDTCKLKISKATDAIKELSEAIGDGKCAMCNRPFDVEHVNSHRTKIAKLKEFIVQTESVINTQQAIIVEAKAQCDKDIEVYLKYRDKLAKIAKSKYELISENDQTLCVEIESLLPNKDSVNEVRNKQEELNKEIATINSEIENIRLIERKKLESIQTRYSELTEKIKTVQTEKDIFSENFNKAVADYNIEFKVFLDKKDIIVALNEKIKSSKLEKVNIEQRLNTIESEISEATVAKNKKSECQTAIESKETEKNELELSLKELNNKLVIFDKSIFEYNLKKEQLENELNSLIEYTKNQYIFKIYQKIIKNHFKGIVFDYYRNYLNNTLNELLSDVSFKLFWNSNSELIMVDTKNGKTTYQPVQLSSGMETTFLGLSLIYTIHTLNIKNSVSNLFIDEVSGTLNNGNGLSYSAENYQELFVKILSKFKDKNVFIIDHNVENLNESVTYEVVPCYEEKVSKFVMIK